MTTATIIDNQAISAPAMWRTDSKSHPEESFNNYWGGFYQYVNELKLEFIIKLLQSLPSSVVEPTISPKNLEAIRILERWFAEPDDLGEDFWNELCEDLEKNRFKISR